MFRTIFMFTQCQISLFHFKPPPGWVVPKISIVSASKSNGLHTNSPLLGELKLLISTLRGSSPHPARIPSHTQSHSTTMQHPSQACYWWKSKVSVLWYGKDKECLRTGLPTCVSCPQLLMPSWPASLPTSPVLWTHQGCKINSPRQKQVFKSVP